jgi:hypothetical protein
MQIHELCQCGRAKLKAATSLRRWPRAIVAVATIIILFSALPVDALIVCPTGSTVPGIEVSHFQGTINWTSVAGAGYQFAFATVSDGLTVDS